jgi:hypothetical protein
VNLGRRLIDKPAFSMGENVQQRFDAFVGGECNLGTFLQEVFCVCDTTPDFVWDVLSLADQYYRRGKLSGELFQTVRYRVERHVLGAPDSDPIREPPDTPVAAEASVGAVRGGAVAIQEQAESRKGSAREIPTPRIELPNARGSARQYRIRIATPADFGHRARSVFANTRRTVGVWRARAREFCRRPRYGEWRWLAAGKRKSEFTGAFGARDHLRLWRPGRAFRAVTLAAVLLGVAAMLVLQVFLRARDTGNTVLPIAAAVVIPQTAGVVTPQTWDPGQISLSADKYVVFPGHASAEIKVRRTSGARGEVSFVWWTQGSRGARPGRDYVSRTRQIAHLLDGVDALDLSVPILANPWRRHTELFYVVISKPGSGASLGSVRRATVFIMRPDQ